MNRRFIPEHLLTGSRHAIDTLDWRSHYLQADLATRHQDEISAFLRGPALDVIGRVCDRLSAPDEVWQIDTLQIDLGCLPPGAGTHEWAERLERVLTDSLLRSRQALAGAGPAAQLRQIPAGVSHSADEQDLLNFLFYLRHGRFHWSMQPLSTQMLSGWLERLARRHGLPLWERLHDRALGPFVLARLSHISPHAGLHALLAVRNAGLASGLGWLDEQVLAPLQASGRLSAFQMGLIQQGWRVTALEQIWQSHSGELDTTRSQRLIQRLWDAVAAQLGPHWAGFLPVSIAPRRRDTAPVAAFSRQLLAGLLRRLPAAGAMPPSATDAGRQQPAPVARAGKGQPATGPRPGADTFTRSALARLQACLGAPRSVAADQPLALLDALEARNPALLRACLCAHVASLDWRLQAWERLGPQVLERIIVQLGRRSEPGTGSTGGIVSPVRTPPATASWAESLRQYSLRASHLPALHGIGGQALQAWLVAFSLRHLAAGHALPQDHVAWQALWDAALSELTGARGAGADPPIIQAGGPPALQGETAAPEMAQAVPFPDTSEISALCSRWALAMPGRRLRLRQALPALQRRLADAMPASVWGSLRRMALRSPDQPPTVLLWRMDRVLAGQLRSHGSGPAPAQLIRTCAQALTENASHPAPACQPGVIQACLLQWASGRVGQSATAWGWTRSMQGRQYAARVVRGWMSARLWREEVVRHWPRQRRLELLALMLGDRAVQWHFGNAVQAWQWLPRLIARQAAKPGTRWASRAVSASLWQEALSWAASTPAAGPAMPGARSLLRHWRATGAAQAWAALQAPDAARLPGRRPPSWGAGTGVSHTLLPTRAGAGRIPLSATAAIAALADLLARTEPQWPVAERLWVARLLAQPDACTEALLRLDIAQRRALLQHQFPAHAAPLLQAADTMEQVLPRLLPDTPATQRTMLHWRILFACCFVAGQPPVPQALVRRYALHLAQFDADHNGRSARPLAIWLNRLAAALQATGHLPAPLHSALQRPPADAEQWEASQPRLSRPVRLPAEQTAEGATHLPADSTPPEAVGTAPGIEPIGIRNAGQVLLAIYHARLFSMLGLLGEKRFVDAAARTRAVHCLAYLVDGRCGSDESDWPLSKVLCGIALDHPVAPLADLDEATRETLDGLLGAVIAHWKVLGHTSPAGLRQTFLQREGLLLHEHADAGWQWRLKVPPGPFDMLLDRIPWSFSVIRSPWMEEVLYVDWR